ncbi:MAG: septum formation initiator family protein [Holosporaceae bacterium]|nr:septum formation initiator family protein [Holosporaceae bacterium]
MFSYSAHKNLKFITSNIIWICIVGYFLFHMFSGARGAVSWMKLSHEVATLERELASIREENAFLENKIKLIKNDNLDLDLLEEQARNILGMAQENDVIVLLPHR